MSAPRYWLATFDPGSWSVFETIETPTLGLKRPKPEICLGDVFLCYVIGRERHRGEWVSAEKVVSEMDYDDRRIYEDGVWPYRWRVENITPRWAFGQGVIARDRVAGMQLFDGLNDKTWGLALRTQGREIGSQDAELLLGLLTTDASEGGS